MPLRGVVSIAQCIYCTLVLQWFSNIKGRQVCPNNKSSSLKWLFSSLSLSLFSLSRDSFSLFYAANNPPHLLPPGLINHNWLTNGGLAQRGPGWPLIKKISRVSSSVSDFLTYHNMAKLWRWCTVWWILFLGGRLFRLDEHGPPGSWWSKWSTLVRIWKKMFFQSVFPIWYNECSFPAKCDLNIFSSNNLLVVPLDFFKCI